MAARDHRALGPVESRCGQFIDSESARIQTETRR
jgi:hypothetical protein